jgi:hypothetical protein
MFFCPTVPEGSGETSQKETSTCDICQFGAECDEDAEDVWWDAIFSLLNKIMPLINLFLFISHSSEEDIVSIFISF